MKKIIKEVFTMNTDKTIYKLLAEGLVRGLAAYGGMTLIEEVAKKNI